MSRMYQCAKLLLTCSLLLLVLISDGESCSGRRDSANFISKQIKSGSVDIEIKGNNVELVIKKNDGSSLHNVLYAKDPTLMTANSPQNITIEDDCEDFTTCIKTKNGIQTKILTSSSHEVIKITRTVNDPEGQIIDCYHINEDTHWFGGPQWKNQFWPIENQYFEERPYVPSEHNNMAITERYWLSSKGIYIFIDEKDPLFLDQNNYRDRHICFIAKNRSPYRNREVINLNYEIGVYQNPRLAHESVVKKHFDKPTGHPDERMIKYPIWSTWARYKININETTVKQFAEEIKSYGFENSQIEIDDNWETCYGSAQFNPIKFPNVQKLTTELKSMGYKVTLWIHPFINYGCNDNGGYYYAQSKGYFVKNLDGSEKSSWWQGQNASTIDFTNEEAVNWWVGRLKKLQELGIDSFKFDAGETTFTPQVPDLHGPIDLQPGIYSLNYTTNLAKHFDLSIEARVGWRTQGLPIFIRMIDKDSRWTWNNGLPTLITTLLQMNLNGYIYVLPDMIGGNGYGENPLTTSVLPSKEMFIRWLQANVFMPSLQYSFVPWDFNDTEVIEICKHYTELHANISSTIVRLMQTSMETGAPLNPPIWWVDPTNRDSYAINDEFLLGEEILAAPVVKEGSVTRDIYLPTGKWRDANTDKIYGGPIWLRDYSAPLKVLPYFYKV